VALSLAVNAVAVARADDRAETGRVRQVYVRLLAWALSRPACRLLQIQVDRAVEAMEVQRVVGRGLVDGDRAEMAPRKMNRPCCWRCRGNVSLPAPT